jgi:5-methylcytosine-specific restriction protein B
VHAGTLDSWKGRNEKVLAGLFGMRYARRAEKAVALRAPDMRASDAGVPYAAYIHPSNADSGAYGGMSFVIFPVEGEPCLVAMVIGTQGLAPDEAILGRPGHARKMQAMATWLNHQFGGGDQVAWAKQDPTRVDIDIPESIQRTWSAYERIFKRYGRVLYAVYRPTAERAGTVAAVTAMLDLMFEERGHTPLKDFQEDSSATRAAWFSHLMPKADSDQVVELLKARRFVILQGPPGTGKTRMARQVLAGPYAGFGRSVQFHPSTTYENFIGGLAPLEQGGNGGTGLGFRFAPKPGFLLEAAAQAAGAQKRYLLHIDEINRADLGKILGEAIYLFEPNPESRRDIDLPYDFGQPFHQRFNLPENLDVLGTMNTADRSIAIVDVAVRRRFAFLSLWPSFEVVQSLGCALGQDAFQRLMSIFVEHAPEEALALVPGHSYFLGEDKREARLNLRTSLVPLLSEYLAQGYVSGFAESIRGYLQWLECQ